MAPLLTNSGHLRVSSSPVHTVLDVWPTMAWSRDPISFGLVKLKVLRTCWIQEIHGNLGAKNPWQSILQSPSVYNFKDSLAGVVGHLGFISQLLWTGCRHSGQPQPCWIRCVSKRLLNLSRDKCSRSSADELTSHVSDSVIWDLSCLSCCGHAYFTGSILIPKSCNPAAQHEKWST